MMMTMTKTTTTTMMIARLGSANESFFIHLPRVWWHQIPVIAIVFVSLSSANESYEATSN